MEAHGLNDDRTAELGKKLIHKCRDSLGGPMIFDVCEDAKHFLSDHNETSLALFEGELCGADSLVLP
jgi:hypothetical protein